MTRPVPAALRADADGDGRVGIGDLPGWLAGIGEHAASVYLWPGDAALVVVLVELPGVAERFAMSTASYGGAFSTAVSTLVWGVLAGLLVLGWRRHRRR